MPESATAGTGAQAVSIPAGDDAAEHEATSSRQFSMPPKFVPQFSMPPKFVPVVQLGAVAARPPIVSTIDPASASAAKPLQPDLENSDSSGNGSWVEMAKEEDQSPAVGGGDGDDDWADWE